MRIVGILSLTSFFSLGLLGCDVIGGSVSTDLEGVYTIDSWTEDDPGCNESALSLPLMERFAVVAASDIVRGPHLFAYPCADVDSCAELQDDSILPGLVPFSSSTTEGDDASGWTGSTDIEFVESEDEDGELCSVTRISWVLEADGPNGVTRFTEHVFGQILDADDCEEASIDDVPEADRCTATTVMNATFERDLPPVPPEE